MPNHKIMAVPAAVERLVGLQAQVCEPPYVGLWSRLSGFGREDLTALIHRREIVRATMMRSTLHLVTARDYLRLRGPLQPALVTVGRGFYGKRLAGLDPQPLLAAAREFLTERPRTYADVRALVATMAGDRDVQALTYAVMRTYLPVVQVPPAGTWRSPDDPTYALAQPWLGGTPSTEDSPDELVLRYLAAFGPASVADVAKWAGLTGLAAAMSGLRPRLRVLRDERGTDLLDLPDAELVDADRPAPVRFLPEYDNLVLSHADRTRVISDADRALVCLSAGRVRATILVDGFVAGAWRVESGKGPTALVVEPFRPLADAEREALAAEGARLLAFVADAPGEVRFTG